MTATAPSVGIRNEAADPLVTAWRQWSDRFARGEGGDTPIRDAFAAGWDAALAHERRATVERIRAALPPAFFAPRGNVTTDPVGLLTDYSVRAILDAAASESEAT